MPGRALAQVVSHRCDIAEARVRSQIIPCEICGVHNGTGNGFSASTSVVSSQYHSTNVPHLSSSTCCSYQKTNERILGTFQKAMFLQMSGVLYRPVLSHLFFRPLCLPTVMQPHATNGPQCADSDLAIVYLLPFAMNRAPPYATNRFTQLIAGTCRPTQTVI